MNNPVGRCLRCWKQICYEEKFCKFCGQKNDSWVVPGKGQCGNCHAYLQPDDKYCRICGTKAGVGAYEPYQDLMMTIYGPKPEKRKHKCKECGYSWETCAMIDKEKFCPKCGGIAPCTEKIWDKIKDLIE